MEKIDRKEYDDPQNQMFDLIALRVITYLESDVKLVSKIILENFNIIKEHSSDKTSDLGTDKAGYRSVHFICTNHSSRLKLPEYKSFNGINFELKIRTILQHAWAEIEHSRRYRFSNALPHEEARTFNLLSANLELLDKQFSTLAETIDRYGQISSEKSVKGDLSDEINSISVKEYLELIKIQYNIEIENSDSTNWEIASDELSSYGIHNIKELNSLFSEDFIKNYSEKHGKNLKFSAKTEAGILRIAMMYKDIERYFSKSYKKNWTAFTNASQDLLEKKYSSEQMSDVKKNYNIKSRKLT